MTLKGGFALDEPTGNSHQERWMITSQRERGVDEGIRLDQRTVEIDAERWKECCVESGIGDGQKRMSFLVGAITGHKLRCPDTMPFQ